MFYTSTKPTNQNEVFNIKPIYNQKYPTRARAKIDTTSRYRTRVHTQSEISSNAVNCLITIKLYAHDLHACSVIHTDTGKPMSYKYLVNFFGTRKLWIAAMCKELDHLTQDNKGIAETNTIFYHTMK